MVFDLISLGIGLVVGVFGTGFVAHRWPAVFNATVASDAVVVNAELAKIKGAVSGAVSSAEKAVVNAVASKL